MQRCMVKASKTKGAIISSHSFSKDIFPKRYATALRSWYDNIPYLESQ
jgi:hypothetical protein